MSVPFGFSQGQHANRQPPDGEQGEEGKTAEFDEAPGQGLEVIDEADALEDVLDIPPEGTAHIVKRFRQAEEEKQRGGRDAENGVGRARITSTSWRPTLLQLHPTSKDLGYH